MENSMRDLLDHCQSLPEVRYGKGEILLSEGDKTGLIFILIDGEIDIIKKDFRVARVAEPGAILGEISALLDIPHMATVLASAPSRLYKVENHADFLKSNTDFCYPLAVLLAQRLNTVTNYLAIECS